MASVAQQAPSNNFVPAIQGLRAIAVLPVMGFHLITNFPAFKPVFNYGWVGVDLFFVISGYLITGILLETRSRPNRWRNFYMRRALKIWPLYYALILLMFAVIPIIRPAEGQMIFAKSTPWWSYLIFGQNFLVKGLGAGPLGVTWSLAIEEQFYLIWPLLVYMVPRRYLKYLLGLGLVVTLCARFALTGWGHQALDIYVNFFCRLDGLVLGSSLALWQRSAAWNGLRDKQLSLGLILCGATGLAVVGLENVLLTYTFLALLFTGIVAVVSNPLPVGLGFLQMKPLVLAGQISYGLYLLHVVVYDVVRSTPLGRFGMASAFIMAGGAFALATVSWYCFEKPILSLKRHFPS